jgi:hypothetical protein
MAISGGFLLLAQTVLFPTLSRRLGMHFVYWTSMLLQAPLFFGTIPLRTIPLFSFILFKPHHFPSNLAIEVLIV